jgi:hypothetical protein
MQAQLAGGEYDPTRTRIMHLVANPAAELARLQDKAELEKLREENASLKQALTARGGAAASSAAGESYRMYGMGITAASRKKRSQLLPLLCFRHSNRHSWLCIRQELP